MTWGRGSWDSPLLLSVHLWHWRACAAGGPANRPCEEGNLSPPRSRPSCSALGSSLSGSLHWCSPSWVVAEPVAAPRTSAVASANERTALSWNRSVLAAIACIAVLVRHVWQLDGVAQELALGLTGVATITWSAAALAFTSVSAQKSSSPTEPAVSVSDDHRNPDSVRCRLCARLHLGPSSSVATAKRDDPQSPSRDRWSWGCGRRRLRAEIEFLSGFPEVAGVAESLGIVGFVGSALGPRDDVINVERSVLRMTELATSTGSLQHLLSGAGGHGF